jgi:hypothetical protein
VNRPLGLPGSGPIQRFERREALGFLPRGYIDGLTLSNDGTDATNDIGVAAGVCRSTVNVVNGAASTLGRDQMDLELPAGIIKQLDVAFAPENYDPEGYSGGDRSGGRSSSALANGTWHPFLVGGPGLQTDVMFHDSITQSSVLAEMQKIGGYTAYRRIGSVIRSAGAILLFFQYGDDFWLKTSNFDANTSSQSTTRVNYPLTAPTGLVLRARISIYMTNSNAGATLVVTNPNLTDTSPTFSTGLLTMISGANGQGVDLEIPTDTSAQISARASASGTTFTIYTRGWNDPRGKDS